MDDEYPFFFLGFFFKPVDLQGVQLTLWEQDSPSQFISNLRILLDGTDSSLRIALRHIHCNS